MTTATPAPRTLGIPSDDHPRWKLPLTDGVCDACQAQDTLVTLNADTANVVHLCTDCIDNIAVRLMRL